MSAPPYMKLFWGDYHKRTRHLKRDQHGAYFLLIGEAWQLGGALPDDDAKLAAWALCTPDEWAAIKPVVMEFFALRRGKWWHDRVREELASYEATSRKRKEAGKKGGKASGGNTTGNQEANAFLLPTKPEPEPEPEEDKKDPPNPQGGEAFNAKPFAKALAIVADAGCAFPALADRIHKAQPVVDGKRRSAAADVQRALGGALKRGGMPSAIWSAVQNFYALPASTKDGGQYANGAAVVLNSDRWKEYAAPAAEESAAVVSTFNAPQVRASIVKATDEDFARRWVDHYCRWVGGTERRLEARTPAVAAALSKSLAGWAERNSVTIAVASANDGAGQAERERAA